MHRQRTASSARQLPCCRQQIARMRVGGFTLVELLVAVAVVAILLAVALPSFLDSIRKGRRADAFGAIAAIQQSQERWRSNNPRYAETNTELATVAPLPALANYTLTVGTPDLPVTSRTGYFVTAEGKTGTSQASDGDCRRLSVQIVGGNVSYASCAACASFTYTQANACWNR